MNKNINRFQKKRIGLRKKSRYVGAHAIRKLPEKQGEEKGSVTE